MYPKQHFLWGFVFSFILFILFPVKIGFIGALIIFLSSFLIDFDHYIYYIFNFTSFSIKKANKYFIDARKRLLKLPYEKRKEYYSGWCFFHGIEWLILFLFLGIFISNYFIFLLIGFSFHLILDWIEESRIHSRKDKLSAIYDFFKFKKLKKI